MYMLVRILFRELETEKINLDRKCISLKNNMKFSFDIIIR